MICPKHNQEMVVQYTRYGSRWYCPEKGCDVVCWDGPHSTPADERTRGLRSRVHLLFDPLWRGRKKDARSRAFKWLQGVMELSASECHVGMFTSKQCEKAISFLEK